MTRYTRELRFRFKGDATLAQRYIPQARVVVGKMLDNYSLGVTTGAMSRTIAPGVVVRASVWDGMPIVEIDVTRAMMEAQEPAAEYGSWVPEGFVFYPASDASPNGWGLPVNYVDDDGFEGGEQIFAPANLAPGLDVGRWTPAGCLGQVLVTRKVNAGYPPLSTDDKQVITRPALYHPQYGPHPSAPLPAFFGEWQAYRLEFVDFDANAAVNNDAREALKKWKHEEFRLLSDYRATLSLSPLLPPVRGYYDSAQATVEWSLSTGWWGHSCEGFPPTWRQALDRAAKNGCRAEYHPFATAASMGVAYPYQPVAEIVYAGMTGDEIHEYDDQTSYPVFSGVTFAPQTPQQAFDGWIASPGHKAIIERSDNGVSDRVAAWTQIGYRAGSACVHFHQQQQWVQCGNRYWHSQHDEVPTLSWYGPVSKNLHDEFWPVCFEAQGSGSDARTMINGYYAPLASAGGEAYCRWASRLYTHGGGGGVGQGLLGPYIFARGRTIAILPDSGFVLAAAFHRHGDYDKVYRLVALGLHPGDQPADPWDGFTPAVRVWWVDLPAHVVETFNGVPTSLIAGTPHTVIRSKYGAEPTEWPWVEPNSPYSWRGGDVIDVSSSGLGRPSGDLKSYASLWEFNSAGTKAVCLRYSYDTVLFDWAPLNTGAYSWTNATSGTGSQFGMSIYPFISDIGMSTGIGGFTDDGKWVSGTPVFCELTFTHDATGVGAGLTAWTHNPAGGFVPNGPHTDTEFESRHWYVCETVAAHQATMAASGWPDAGKFWRRLARVTPVYAFYDGDGETRAVYDVETNMSCVFREQWMDPPLDGYIATNLSQTRLFGGVNPGVFYRGVSVGASVVDDAACLALVAEATHYSSEIGANGVNTIADFPVVLHADDSHLVFAALGVDSPAIATQGDLPGGFPFNLQPRDSTGVTGVIGFGAAVNPAWNPCDVVNTGRAVIQLDVYLNGERVHQARLANPNPYFVHRAWLNPWDIADRRAYALGGVLKRMYFPRWNTAWGLTGGFTKSRSDDWALALTFGVQSQVMAPTDVLASYTNDFGTQYTFAWPSQTTMFSALGPFNAGGFMSASFATQNELAEMMQIPGSHPRAHYVRIV